MLLRIGCVFLVPLLFADWTDNVLAEFLTPEDLPVCTAPTLQLAIVGKFQFSARWEDEAAQPPLFAASEHGACLNTPAEQLRTARALHTFLPPGSDLIYLLMSLQR